MHTVITKISKFIELNKKQLIAIAKVIVAAGFIIYLATMISFSEIINAYNESEPIYIFIAAVLLIPNLFMQFLKWEYICSLSFGKLGRSKIFYSLMHGMSAGIITPFGVGEYVGRSFALKDQKSIDIVFATFIDKMFSLAVLMFFGSLSTIVFIHRFYNVDALITTGLFLAVFSIFAILFYLLLYRPKFIGFLFKNLKSSKFSKSNRSSFQLIKNVNNENALVLSLFSASALLISSVQFALLVMAFVPGVLFFEILWGAIVVFFTKALIPAISLGDLGVREGLSILIFDYFAVSSPDAFNSATLIFVINLLIPSLIGLILLTKKS
ncbi:MAG: flippase-like domain-containing protein [Melioribacteraceae bacterium]|nr:flippase-like domain-containing protein [Melioribacteraceae bacterium]MCF8354640.1 flippase-like domain-containing protein [Melioribacteraceae bacterium]MCF8394185.1 flippase-like domain-containing protein [Melioribacteraceae bacterium]MCF8418868.1 flippase-like domain-containing protein [Melioribacteraceae bacterium]